MKELEIEIKLSLEKARKVNWSREYGYFSMDMKCVDDKGQATIILHNLKRFFKLKKAKNKISNDQFDVIRKKLSTIVQKFNEHSVHMSLKNDGTYYDLSFDVATLQSVYKLNALLGDGSYYLIDKNDFLQ